MSDSETESRPTLSFHYALRLRLLRRFPEESGLAGNRFRCQLCHHIGQRTAKDEILRRRERNALMCKGFTKALHGQADWPELELKRIAAEELKDLNQYYYEVRADFFLYAEISPKHLQLHFARDHGLTAKSETMIQQWLTLEPNFRRAEEERKKEVQQRRIECLKRELRSLQGLIQLKDAATQTE